MSKPGYLRHVMGSGKFREFLCKDADISQSDTISTICGKWAAHTILSAETIPDREQNAIKIAADITVTGSPIIAMEMGHINTADDFSHSYVQMLIPLTMVPTYQEELETHKELQVYFIDAKQEIDMITKERMLNEAQRIKYGEEERKTVLIAKVTNERYYNFTGLHYPLAEIFSFPNEIRDHVANDYVCMNVSFIEASPETRIDFLLSPILGIASKK